MRWLFARAWIGTERPSILFDRAVTWLISRKILLPGVTVLEREVARIRDRATSRLWRALARAVTLSQQVRLDALLVIPAGERLTLLDRLRRVPTIPSSQGLLEALARLTDVRDLGVGPIDLHHIPFSRLQALARFALTAKAQTLARMPPERRTATLLAFARVLEALAQDTALDLLDDLLATLFTEATKAGTQARVRTLKDLDAAALQLATVAAIVLDPTVADTDIRVAVQTHLSSEALSAALAQVRTLARPPDDTFYDELRARYRRVSRVRPTLLSTLSFDALPTGRPVLAGYQFLQRIEGQARPAMRRAPFQVVTRAWRRYVVTANQDVDRMAYTYCVLDRLKDALRRREVFVTPSLRYADPRLGMLEGAAWEAARPQVCRALQRSANGAEELERLAQLLDMTYRRVAAALPQNTAVTITLVDDKPDLTLSPLDKLDEPASLITLRTSVDALLPRADLPEVLLEIQRRTGFLAEFTHLSEAEARATDLDISLCAVLIAEACNIGLTPLINPAIPALTRDRLAWTQQNYLRPETMTRANARLVEAQSQIWLAQRWGGGEVASADGMRFVVPIRTV